MSTYIIDSEPEIVAVADADEMLIHDNDAAVTKKVGVDVLRQYMGGGLVSIAAADSITPAEHANRTLVFNIAAGVTVTLPAATGTGDVYKFVVGVTVTSVADVIQVANATDEFVGTMYQTDTDTADALVSYPALDGDGFDTITMDGSTKGGIQGDSITITDIAAGKFLVEGFTNGSGTVASPWSAAVS